MNTDIRIAVSFKGHRKRKKLKMILGDKAATDYLIDFWITVAMDRPSGNLSGLDEIDICLMAGGGGEPGKFVSAMVESGFLDKAENGYLVHEWEIHNGYASAANARSESSRNAAKARWNKRLTPKEDMRGQCGGNAGAMPEDCGGNAPIPIPSPIPSPVPIPSPINKKKAVPIRPDFISEDLWCSLLENRKHKKLSNSPIALTTFCNAVKVAIDQGYTDEECIGDYVSTGKQRFNVEWLPKAKAKDDGF